MAKWFYRKRLGVQVGKWVVGYERRIYRLSLPVAWPTVYRDPCATGDCPGCSGAPGITEGS